MRKLRVKEKIDEHGDKNFYVQEYMTKTIYKRYGFLWLKKKKTIKTDWFYILYDYGDLELSLVMARKFTKKEAKKWIKHNQ